MAEQSSDTQKAPEQSASTMTAEVMRHAQDMTNDVVRHVPEAAGDVVRHAQNLTGEVSKHSRVAADDIRRETPILMGHLWDHISGWFSADKLDGKQ